MTGSIFAKVEPAPRDPILGLIEGFNHDSRAQKVNLGVGVYLGEDGCIPVVRAVAEAERRRAAEPSESSPLAMPISSQSRLSNFPLCL